MQYEIPVLFVVQSTNEDRAEKQLIEFLMESTRDYGTDHRIADWELIEEDD